MTFENWLATLLGQRRTQVQLLLQDSTALQFLIAWSLFESKCFDGFVKIAGLDKFAARLASESFDPTLVLEAASHFHTRYQDRGRYEHLMHRQSCERLDALVRNDLGIAGAADVIFLVAVVAYRFRNNMFHGNKGVASWLQYKTQIQLCTEVLQHFVSHAESRLPSLREAA
jgi:hypothetical protein